MNRGISIIIPLFILVVFLIALKEKQDVLKLFTDGVVEGLKVVLKIFPHIFAITIAICLLRDTGLLEKTLNPFLPLLRKIGVPEQIIPLAVFRPLSGGASMSVVMEIFKQFGPDSIEGKIASIIMGGTETTFYAITVLYGAVSIKKVRGTLLAALIADAVAVIAAIVLVNIGLV